MTAHWTGKHGLLIWTPLGRINLLQEANLILLERIALLEVSAQSLLFGQVSFEGACQPSWMTCFWLSSMFCSCKTPLHVDGRNCVNQPLFFRVDRPASLSTCTRSRGQPRFQSKISMMFIIINLSIIIVIVVTQSGTFYDIPWAVCTQVCTQVCINGIFLRAGVCVVHMCAVVCVCVFVFVCVQKNVCE